ncbi:MAG: hypothetical protein ISS56_04805 [Anaerolineae bacterium]|nr:hypothetical protein [Anaerolineae bacterium]
MAWMFLVGPDGWERPASCFACWPSRVDVSRSRLRPNPYGTFQTFNEALEKIYGGEVSAAEAMEWAQERSQYDYSDRSADL